MPPRPRNKHFALQYTKNEKRQHDPSPHDHGCKVVPYERHAGSHRRESIDLPVEQHWNGKNADRKGTRKVAEAYLQYLYSDEGQEIAAKNFYRPINEKIKAKFEKTLPKLPLFTIDQAFGGWDQATKVHFADGGLYDQISLSIKR